MVRTKGVLADITNRCFAEPCIPFKKAKISQIGLLSLGLPFTCKCSEYLKPDQAKKLSHLYRIEARYYSKLIKSSGYPGLASKQQCSKTLGNSQSFARKTGKNGRGETIAWMHSVSKKLDIIDEALFLATFLLRCFLDKNTASKRKKVSEIRKYAMSCFLIACKYEEIYPPEVRDLEIVSSCSTSSILKAEIEVLEALNFKIAVPTAQYFYAVYVTVFVDSCDIPEENVEKVESLTSFLMKTADSEISIKLPGSLVAAASLTVALQFLSDFKDASALSKTFQEKLKDILHRLTPYGSKEMQELETWFIQKAGSYVEQQKLQPESEPE